MPKEDQAAFNAAKYGKFPGALFLDVNGLNLNDARDLLKHVGSNGFQDITKAAGTSRYKLLYNAAYVQGGQAMWDEPGVLQHNVSADTFDENDPAYQRKPSVVAAIAKYKEWQAANKPQHGGHHKPAA